VGPSGSHYIIGPLQKASGPRKKEKTAMSHFWDTHHSDNFRYLRARGVLRGIFVPMNLGTYGFQFWRQNGFEGWPITITPLSLSPDERARNKYQLLVAVTPGPKQPVDLESFLHPIMDELNELAKGIPGPRVAGLTFPQV